MKRTLIFFLLMAFILSGTVLAEDTASISAKAAIIYEPVTGTVFYGKNENQSMLIASTTKILTALVVLENCSLTEVVTIPQNWSGVEGSSMYLKPGQKITVEELMYGLLLESGNDAAEILALHTAGSIDIFAEMMNEKAKTLGCINSHFSNPHGLDAEDHYSSAKDLALIMAEAIKNDEFLRISSTSSVSIEGRQYQNHNRLGQMYDGVICGKTGYTMSAGRTLVTCAKRDGLTLICVTLSAPDDWNDHMVLYDMVFSKYTMVSTPVSGIPVGEIEVISGERSSVSVTPKECCSLIVERGDAVELITGLEPFAYAEVKKGDKGGELYVTVNGETVFKTDLLFTEGVSKDNSELLSGKEKIIRRLKGLL